MSGWLLLAAMVAAVNPARSRTGMERAPWPALVIGGAAGVAGVGLLAVVADGLLRLLEISPETFLIAAGLVAVVAGARTMLFPMASPESPLRGPWQGLWPIAFPRILSPEVMALALALVSQRGVGAVTTASAVGVALLMALGGVGVSERGRRVLAAVGGVAGAVLCVVGIWMMIEGIRDV